jgi:hypothetical protein
MGHGCLSTASSPSSSGRLHSRPYGSRPAASRLREVAMSGDAIPLATIHSVIYRWPLGLHPATPPPPPRHLYLPGLQRLPQRARVRFGHNVPQGTSRSQFHTSIS